MNELTIEKMHELMGILSLSGLGNTPPDDKLKAMTGVYFLQLKQYDELILTQAILNLAGSAKFFPSVGDIKAACAKLAGEDDEAKVEKAWKRFRNHAPNLYCSARPQDYSDDPALKACIDGFHQDWSNAAIESSSYWWNIFKDAYANYRAGQVTQSYRKQLDKMRTNAELEGISQEDFLIDKESEA